MNSIQPVVWTNHEITDLKHTIEYTNSHILDIARNIENLSKLLDSISTNFMLMAMLITVGPWFLSRILCSQGSM